MQVQPPEANAPEAQKSGLPSAMGWPWPGVPAAPQIQDFATMERGDRALLILRAEPNLTTPVSARWLPTAVELSFENPMRRINLFVDLRFKKKWKDKLFLVLFQGDEIVKGAISISDAIAVPMLPFDGIASSSLA